MSPIMKQWSLVPLLARLPVFLSSSFAFHKFSINECFHCRRWTQLNEKSDLRETEWTTSEAVAVAVAEQAFAVLARNDRSWNRLKSMAQLCLEQNQSMSLHTVADIGVDHGLLTVALALSTRFDSVLGVDISQQALQGALNLKQNVLNYREKSTPNANTLNLEFRVGDGLRALQPGEADVICVAGMGPTSIANILSARCHQTNALLLDTLGTRKICIQPTNSRPRKLMLVYDALNDLSWQVDNECINQVAGRYYISSSFIRSADWSIELNCALPGMMLYSNPDTCEKFESYRAFHGSWIRQDEKISNILRDDDRRWLDCFENNY